MFHQTHLNQCANDTRWTRPSSLSGAESRSKQHERAESGGLETRERSSTSAAESVSKQHHMSPPKFTKWGWIKAQTTPESGERRSWDRRAESGVHQAQLNQWANNTRWARPSSPSGAESRRKQHQRAESGGLETGERSSFNKRSWISAQTTPDEPAQVH